MSKVYLKTYFHMPHEFKWLNLHLREGYEFIDGFIFCEFNRTHTGHSKDFIWEDHVHELDSDKMDKVHYFAIDLSDKAIIADEATIHKVNVPYMRSAFMDQMSFDPDDIIISVDADEIVYGEMLPSIISALRNQAPCIRLDMHQFFYRINYLWEHKDWDAAIACRFDYYTHRSPPAGHVAHQWRYEGSVPITPVKVGCHFSWVMSIEEMIYKANFAGHIRFAQYGTYENFEKAIRQKTTFHPASMVGWKLTITDLEFSPETLSPTSSWPLYPKGMFYRAEEWDPYIYREEAE